MRRLLGRIKKLEKSMGINEPKFISLFEQRVDFCKIIKEYNKIKAEKNAKFVCFADEPPPEDEKRGEK